MNYVGVDIDKRYSVLVAVDERGRELGRSRINGNTAFGFAQPRSLCAVSANLLTHVCCAAPRRPESLPGAARRAIRCRLSKTQAQGLMNI